jgi:hypothetical protein
MAFFYFFGSLNFFFFNLILLHLIDVELELVIYFGWIDIGFSWLMLELAK